MKTKRTRKVNRFELNESVKYDPTWNSQEIQNDTFRQLDDLTDRLFGSRQELIDRFAEIQRVTCR